MVHKLIALVLALIIGNPVCCCAMVELFGGDAGPSSPSHSCCCLEENLEGDQQDPEEPVSCSCFLTDDGVVRDIQTPFLKSSENFEEEFSPETLLLSRFSYPSILVVHSGKWPPGRPPVMSAHERRSFLSSYLL